jgi:hypothetical protein
MIPECGKPHTVQSDAPIEVRQHPGDLSGHVLGKSGIS